jgi:UDP-glucuronate 4-epimerase
LKILVTGGAGFLGSHLIDRLMERGDEVVCLDSFTDYYAPAVKRRNIKPHANNPRFTLVEGDVCQPKLVAAVFDRFHPERVVHLAARVGVAPSVADPLAYEEVNCRGTLELLMQSAKYSVQQFVFASSSSVYGIGRKMPLSETESCRPISPYAATKRAGELFCHTYHHLHGLPVTCLRFFTAYGPRQRPDMAIHKFVRAIDQQKPIQRYGDGSSRRDYTYAGDIVQGIEAALDKVFDFEIINLGESRTIALNELIAAVENVAGRKAVVEEFPARAEDVPETFADIAKAKKLLGYAPKVAIEEGLARFWEWFQENREPAAGGGG